MEWKRDVDDNNGGEGKITELLTAPPTRYNLISDGVKPLSTDSELQSSKHQSNRASKRAGSIQTATQAGEMEQEGIELALPTHSSCVRQRLSSRDKEDSVIC